MEETTKRIIEIDIDLGASKDRLAEVTKELDDLRKGSSELRKQNAELLESVRNGEKAWSDVSKQISDNTKQLADNEAKTKALKAEQSTLTGQITETTKENRKYGDSYKELSAQLSDMKNAYRSLTKEQRESSAGKELLESIRELDKAMKDADASIGNFQRNVGNYKSAVEGLKPKLGELKDSMGAVGASTKGVDGAMKILGKNPIMIIIGVVIGLLVKLKDKMVGTEKVTASLHKATESLQPVLELTGKWIAKIADLLSNVLDWAIEKAIQSIGWLGRQLQKVGSLFGADWGGGLIDFSVKMEAAAKKTEETTVAVEENTEAVKTHTKAVKEDTEAVADNTAELEKQAEEYRKLTLEEMQKAEDALNSIIEDAFDKRRAIEDTAYRRKHETLLASIKAEEEAHGKETELYQAYLTQIEVLEKQHAANLMAIDKDKADKEDAIEKENNAKAEKDAEALKRIEKSRLDYTTSVVNSLSDLLESVADDNKAMVKASKIVALAEVAIKQGVAIADAVAASAAGDPYTYALRVASAIASTVAAMATAIKSINSVKLARGTSYVQGPGTETSDSIPAMLSKGEGVVNARANRMFPGVVGAMNDASVGIWSPMMSMLRNSGGAPAQVVSPMQMSEVQMAEAFRAAVEDLNIAVSVEEINRVGGQVKVVENLGSI